MPNPKTALAAVAATGVAVATAGGVLLGIDVSHYQAGLTVNSGATRSFVVAKVTEGTSYRDRSYASFRDAAIRKNIPFGAYHYLHHAPTAEARYAVNAAGKSVPIAVDCEYNSGCTGADVRTFVTEVRRLGGKVSLLYVPRSYWKQIGSPNFGGLNTSAAPTALWNAAYPGGNSGTWQDSMRSSSHWADYAGLKVVMWQYSDSRGRLDVDAFRGSRADLCRYLYCASTSPGTTAPKPPSGPPCWTTRIDNPLFPMAAGDRWVWDGVEDGQKIHQVATITGKTRVLAGVTTLERRDTAYRANGSILEDTTDYHVQRIATRDVWYYGEQTATYDAAGHLQSREGSWLAGVNGARPGIYISGTPQVGVWVEQEHYPGHAMDQFRVVSTHATVKALGRTFTNAVQTQERSPLEPGVLENKWYAPGIGMVKDGTLTLTSYTHATPGARCVTSATGHPVLRQGSRGAQVMLVQCALRTLAVDGVFGPRTAATVAAFKRNHGLAGTSIVDGPTWAALVRWGK